MAEALFVTNPPFEAAVANNEKEIALQCI